MQRQEDVVIDTAKSADGKLLAADRDLPAQDAELVALEGRRCPDPLGERDQDLSDLRFLDGADHQRTSLEDPGFLSGYGLHRGTEETLMVKGNRCHDGDLR